MEVDTIIQLSGTLALAYLVYQFLWSNVTEFCNTHQHPWRPQWFKECPLCKADRERIEQSQKDQEETCKPQTDRENS